MSVTRRTFLRTGTASLASVSVAPGALAMSQVPAEPELPAAGFQRRSYGRFCFTLESFFSRECDGC